MAPVGQSACVPSVLLPTMPTLIRYVRERERERVGERENAHSDEACLRACLRERESGVYVCVCVSERERERERERESVSVNDHMCVHRCG